MGPIGWSVDLGYSWAGRSAGLVKRPLIACVRPSDVGGIVVVTSTGVFERLMFVLFFVFLLFGVPRSFFLPFFRVFFVLRCAVLFCFCVCQCLARLSYIGLISLVCGASRSSSLSDDFGQSMGRSVRPVDRWVGPKKSPKDAGE